MSECSFSRNLGLAAPRMRSSLLSASSASAAASAATDSTPSPAFATVSAASASCSSSSSPSQPSPTSSDLGPQRVANIRRSSGSIVRGSSHPIVAALLVLASCWWTGLAVASPEAEPISASGSGTLARTDAETCLSGEPGSCTSQANASSHPRTILETWFAPSSRSDFLLQNFERSWALYRHPTPLVPIDLDSVAEWMYASKEAAKSIEILPHPKGRREYRGKKGALSKFEDAFLKGHSMVINSLHLWSEPAIRVARELFYDIGLPVDVYMYLTPPFSESYGQHCDVMDAFMVQLVGSKTWVLCEERNYRSAPSEEYTGTCQEITLSGGDIMYVPFNVMHYVKTEGEVSAHLTINVERQYYVWASLLLAGIHKMLRPNIEVDEFLQADVFTMESEQEGERYFHELMHRNEQLARIPLSGTSPDATKWLTMALGGNDLPPDYTNKVRKEMQAVVTETLQALEKEPKLANQPLRIWGQRRVAKELLALISAPSEGLVEWLLEVARFHCLSHFSRDRPKRLLPKVDIFQSLSELRRRGEEGNPPPGGSLLRHDSRLQRRSGVKAVLRKKPSTGSLVLNLNSQAFELPLDQEPLLYFALGLFDPRSSRGAPFEASEVPGGFEASKMYLDQLVLKGALEILPAAG